MNRTDIRRAAFFPAKACAAALVLALFALPLAAESEIVKLEATASFYAEAFHGRPTASGEVFDMNALTAAHRTLPFGTVLEVTNLANGKKTIVRVNDRGPFVEGRELDVSKAAAYELGMITTGTARVSIRKLSGMDAAAVSAGAAPQGQPALSDRPATVDAAPASVETPTPAANLAVATPTDASGLPARWRIQLAAFSREDNANRLVVKLRKDGFNPAFERTSTVIRVVLAGIPDAELGAVRGRLDSSGYSDYLVRKESR
ncbi:MAG TPA: septal ring lytic transglycosylase RlpA family protein [Treponemataceae bacterium]|nr:septal ring lytic transglycosylase RlpA family protein [Treponemataceae bacterium]